jgi:hypothetical protein
MTVMILVQLFVRFRACPFIVSRAYSVGNHELVVIRTVHHNLLANNISESKSY